MNTTDKIMALADEYAKHSLCIRQDGVILQREVLRKEIEALVRDAERYRALEWAQEADSLGPIFVARVRRKYPRFMFNVGLTIDAAMQEKQS